MKASAQAVIERLQPYHGGQEDDPLWMLHEFARVGKGGSGDPVCTVLDGSTYKVGDLDRRLLIKDVEFVFGPAQDKATIGHMLVNRWDRALERSVKFDFACDLAFPHMINDAGQPLPTNGRLINLTTKLRRDAVWDTCWRLCFFTGRKSVGTIESAPLPRAQPAFGRLWAP